MRNPLQNAATPTVCQMVLTRYFVNNSLTYLTFQTTTKHFDQPGNPYVCQEIVHHAIWVVIVHGYKPPSLPQKLGSHVTNPYWCDDCLIGQVRLGDGGRGDQPGE
jgi:hypothetical protein